METKLTSPIITYERRGNIEYRAVCNIEENYIRYIEVVQWYPNPYYGKESEYIKLDDDTYVKDEESLCYVHSSCFQNPESCITLVIISIKDEPDVRSIGLRPFELNEQDERDFKDIITKAYDAAYKEATKLR